ncbi:Arabinose 5-phosphate isomerase KdsD [Posidoniimonas corsicana]|uniref:Arabinose 5-phosphate isomerase KdsD n=1 Tax=Posidoniimonas corsicana TaxID=1938618 RepID=A0A5C5VFM6_9BACT|nr:KpsF/GutQ family sugar-phosphate isomerase [Posidoniimonas corsicana]TWT36747.1 Arabinose 5-phosphate isomerase KdsD [Posidoniimonas corsicana]
MSQHSAQRDGSPPPALTPHEQLRAAKEIVRREAIALWHVSNRLDGSFTNAVKLVQEARGDVIVTGMGKAGIIAQKIAATLASTGAHAHFVHPAEAFHGDLGRFHDDDVVLALSQSGETAEVTQLLPSLRSRGLPIIAVTASAESTLGRAAEVVLELGKLEEVCSLGLAPSTSTTVMLALGDALALVLSSLRGFREEDFAKYHPGGALGRKLSNVEDVMRPLKECRVANLTQTAREVLIQCSRPGRRSGAIMLLDDAGRLAGLFTDSDLARLFEHGAESKLDTPIQKLMIARPTSIQAGSKTSAAVELLAERKFSELPVVDAEGKPVGMIDVTDVVGMRLSGDKSAQKPGPQAGGIRIFPGEDVFAAG